MKILAKNRRASFDYKIESRLIAGIVLSGHEVKSARRGDISLNGSFANIHDGELWLFNCHIGPYQFAALKNYESTATRKLLIKKSELKKLLAAKQNGNHIIPTIIGIQKNFIKVELGIGKSAKKHDKRHSLKRKDNQRDIDRGLKENQ